MTHRIAVFVAASFALNACAVAGSVGPTTATLRAGTRASVVLTTSKGGQDAETGHYQLRIGDTTFTGEYFAAEGDEPSMRIVPLAPQQEVIVVSAPEPVDCRYDVYGDAASIPRKLVTITSRHCRAEPAFPGDATIRSVAWEGFWERPVVYVRRPDGTLAESADRIFAVGISAPAARTVAVNRLTIRAGTNVRVVQYDLEQRRYELQTSEGRAWVDAAGLSELLPDLPWAE